MNKSKLIILGCIFILMLASSVFAADGVYISGNIGLTILNDSDLTSSAAPGVTVETEFDAGLDVYGAMGFVVGQARIELELAYRINDIDSFTSGVTVSGGGEVSALSGLVNAFYDIKTDSKITPYIGGGLGVAYVEIDNLLLSFNGITIPGNEDDTVFAYQVGGGIAYAINDKMTADLGYRYFATEDPDFDGLEAEYDSHNITIGIRFAL